MIDHQLIAKNSLEYIEYLIGQLGGCYDDLYGQEIELENLANVVDGLQFIQSKLGEHSEALEKRRVKLLATYDEGKENGQAKDYQSKNK